jgi:hypothetical protein
MEEEIDTFGIVPVEEPSDGIPSTGDSTAPAGRNLVEVSAVPVSSWHVSESLGGVFNCAAILSVSEKGGIEP